MESWEEIGAALADAGLSEAQVLRSTGIAEHRRRWEQGQVSGAGLRQYAADLRVFRGLTSEQGVALPTDFWDVNTDAMRAEQINEYALAHMLSRPMYNAYIAFLCRCFEHLKQAKRDGQPTAVATALALLQESAGHIAAGRSVGTGPSSPRLDPRQKAVFLWQQVVAGTNREVPYVHRDAYTHGIWGRFNVVEMWKYATGIETSVDEVWGLSGFDNRFIRDATNTNQIEHMTISALAQISLRFPVLFLNVLEDAEWMLRKGTYAASQADKALNRAVGRYFVPEFRLEDPRPACDSLERVLAGGK